MQRSLASIITTCGSTLHETLTSVLSYAKINQFERRQHEYRNRRPPNAVWALSEKEGLASGPDRDYEGLYIRTNLALLCEEILGVLEAGKSFQGSHGGDVIVVCNIDYEDNWDYYTEPGALRRIAVNLIGNALKYTESGSVIATLSASKMIQDPGRVSNDLDTGRTVNLLVKDTGRGMSKDFMDNQLFLPFTQEDSTSTHGVGLGMSIVKSLISLLSGEIQVRSEEKNGTEIDVRVPMRMCKPDDDDEKGHAAAQFEKDIRTLRDRKLSAVIYGFPDFVRHSLKNYLCGWYDCELLEPTKDAKPDIVLVDEGNEDVLEAVKETAHGYGKQGVLLSIVMVPSRLGKRMDTIDGYIKWERIPRPLGPNNVAKGLLSCLEKLDELRKHGANATVDKEEVSEEHESKEQEPDRLQKLLESLPDEQFMPSLEKLQISESSQSPLASSASLKQPPKSSESSGNKDEPSNKSTDQKVEPKLESKPPLRILVVDDNALNLRLLGAFFKKTGYRNTQQAEQGREAVEAVQNCGEGFDIIFMGKYEFRSSFCHTQRLTKWPDLSMPVMDGFEATRQIRKMEDGYDRAPATKRDSVIIALTGLASREDEDEAFKAGVDMFLTKPVQFPKLSNLLRQYEEGTLKRRRRSEGSC
jgi:CheY-like chemotaxis protein